MSQPFKPAMPFSQVHALLSKEGSPLETVKAKIGSETYTIFKNQPPTFRFVWETSKAYGDLEYIVYGNERYTYKQAHKITATLAHLLVTKYGITKGDRVAILMRNLPEWIFAWWAVLSIGAICVPLNAWLTGEELSFAIGDSEPKVIFADVERLDRVQQHLGAFSKSVKSIITTRAPNAAALQQYAKSSVAIELYADVLKKAPVHEDLPNIAVLPEDDATIMYTSGTTGRPKGALSSHRNGTTMIMVSALIPVRATLRRGEMPSPPDPSAPKPVLMMPVPLFHATGNLAILTPGTIAGGKLVLMFKWDAEEALKLIEKEKVATFIGVPSMNIQMIEHPNFRKYDLSSLSGLSSGGAPAPAELIRHVPKSFKNANPAAGWGMTETSAAGLNIGYEDYLRKPSSIGVPPPICELKIVDTDTLKEVAQGAVGEILIRGPNVMKEYYKRPDANKKEFIEPGHWLRTGDLGRVDEEGMYYIVDRAKDMLLRGGENVYCKEIEDVLYEHPAIVDAAVVGLPHKVLGEEVGAAVQIKADYWGKTTQQDIQKFLAGKLAGFKIPVFIDLRNEPLQRNAAGKILKRDVKVDVVALFEKSKPKSKL